MKRFLISFVIGLSVVFSAYAEVHSSGKEKVVYIVRHGKTMFNATDRVQGWSDTPLVQSGIDSAAALGRGFKQSGITFDAVYSSDSGRSVETAEIILASKGQYLPVKKDWRFREVNFGSYEGEKNEVFWTEIATLQGKTLKEWMSSMTPKNFVDSAAQLDKKREIKGETWPAEDYEAVTARWLDGLNSVVKESDGNILIVSHGLSIMSLVAKIAPDYPLPVGKPLPNSSVTKVIYKEGKYTVEIAGDLQYLEKGKAIQ